MNQRILFQDDYLLVLDKPAGIVVNRAESVKGETVEEWVRKHLYCHSGQAQTRAGILLDQGIPGQARDDQIRVNHTQLHDFIARAGVVHRIDKETSGILLVAKTSASFLELQRQFKERMVEKTYIALVHGDVTHEGEIRAPVGRLPWNREHFGIVPGGKEAVTRFRKIPNDTCKMPNGEKVSLVEVYPKTGRTHQIRVHFKYIGHPLVGDYLYGGRKKSKDDRQTFPRVMLHAWKISFLHPQTHTPLEFEAPIPDDMKRIFKFEVPSTKFETINKH